jgi:hypothetical protein
MTTEYSAWLMQVAQRDAALVGVLLLSVTFLVAALLVLLNVEGKWRARLTWICWGGACTLYYTTLAFIK